MKQTFEQPQALLYLHPRSSFLRIAGQHQVDFLQRQVTNDLKSLAAGTAILAALTTPMARILDLFYFFRLPGSPGAGEAVCALGLPDRAAATTAYLNSRIFYMDQVTMEDVSREYHQADLFGPQAARVLPGLGIPHPLQPGQVKQVELAGMESLALGHVRGGGLGTRFIFPASGAGTLMDVFSSAGAALLDLETYEKRRVEAGLPGPGRELGEEYTPLEVSLESAISGQKGCYTGQEVIARQITYDKVARKLAGLRLDAPAPVGASILANGKPVGVVTSAVISDTFGPIALAVLRRPAHEPGSRLVVRGESGETTAIVAVLPFENSPSPA